MNAGGNKAGPDAPGGGRRGLSWRAALVLIVAMLLGLGAWIFHRIETWPARTAGEIKRAFEELANLQPRITINDRVFFEQTQSVLELAVASRETQVERETEQEWLGSRKRIRLRAVYHVKAGFDLAQPFTVRVEGDTIFAELPPPRILAVDQADIEVLALENGIWNRVRPQDVESELRALPVLARQRASEAGLQREALEIFTARLREKFAGRYKVEVSVRTAPGVPSPVE